MEFFASNLIAHEFLHLLAGSIVALIIFKKYKSFKLIVLVFLVTFLIDADHLTEGFLVNGGNFRWLLAPFNGDFFRKAGKLTIFFHSWEALILILLIGKKIGKWKIALTVVMAAIGHYIVDQSLYTSLYGMSIFQYFLTFRAWHHFEFLSLCGGCLK